MRLFFFGTLLFFWGNATHKFYVSVNQIVFNSDKNRIEITNRIFIDDLNAALELFNKNSFEIEYMTESSESFRIFCSYYQSNFKININKRECAILIKSFEIEEDVFVIYALVDRVSKVKTFEIENNLLFELYPSQQHINHIEINNFSKSTLLDSANRKTLLNF